jgi:hypothetical protein
MFGFKILFVIIFIIISDENVNHIFSQIHVRVAYLFLYLVVKDRTTTDAHSLLLAGITEIVLLYDYIFWAIGIYIHTLKI